RGEDEQAEAEGFGRADSGGDRGAEPCAIGHRELTLKFDGGMSAMRVGLVEELPPAWNRAEHVGLDGETASLGLALQPANQLLAAGDRRSAAVLLAGAIGVVHPQLLGRIGQEA